jgi:hypothetical protein
LGTNGIGAGAKANSIELTKQEVLDRKLLEQTATRGTLLRVKLRDRIPSSVAISDHIVNKVFCEGKKNFLLFT